MTEPTVQVPVSLVDQAAEILEGLGYSSLPDSLRALLSQSTRSAETIDDRAVEAFGPGVLERTGPPDIADMAPGTTFTARVKLPGAVDDRFTVMSGPANIWLRGGQYEVTMPDRIDPSTIHDVTPPS